MSHQKSSSYVLTAKLLVFSHRYSILLLRGLVLGPITFLMKKILKKNKYKKNPSPPSKFYDTSIEYISSVLTGNGTVINDITI